MQENYEKAKYFLPERWYSYENRWLTLGISAATAVGIFLFLEQLPLQFWWYSGFAAAGLYILGILADHRSTRDFFAMIEGKEDTLPVEVKESNPFLPDHPTKDDLRSPKMRLLEAGSVFVAFAVPPVGFGLALDRYLCSLNNDRKRKRLELMETLTQENPQ